MSGVVVNAPLRIGVLGCAQIAKRRMLPAFAACPDVEIAVTASRSLAKAELFAAEYGCRAAGGYADVLSDDSVQAVYVPLPPALHAEWIEAALVAGKHVLVEKPMTIDAATTARLRHLAGSLGLVLAENVFFVNHSKHSAVRDMVADGVVGDLHALHADFTVPSPPDDDIRHQPELGGGALWDTAVYPVRVALFFLGPRLRVVGATRRRSSGRAVDTGGAALLVTPEGVSAQLGFGLDHGYRSAYRLVGTSGSIIVEHAFTPPADHESVVVVRDGVGERVLRLPADDQVANTVAAFVAAVRSGQVVGEESRRQAELLDAIRRS
ncbi:Gfo/Idh/MocA family oxidoreductase [Lentzea sp. PSKA42]|uniref:Gfo/Idh/MocA family oxidoreductase n=1 Tax=Lentzea indica TaxID=2604800 RepID=A0ABX1FUE1_9PSEU|nr:Gfo/Idh/MocA family oxidoreductase [Lentzea indica]NKE62661.1 Gfo/Idh/MocA family oxidoreductase [Lentzea indica]